MNNLNKKALEIKVLSSTVYLRAHVLSQNMDVLDRGKRFSLESFRKLTKMHLIVINMQVFLKLQGLED